MPEKSEWLVGLKILLGTGADLPLDPAWKESWLPLARDANDAFNDVDRNLEALRSGLLGSGDEELEDIAEEYFGNGFGELHGGMKVRLRSAVLGVETANGQPAYVKALNEAMKQSSAYLAHIASSARVKACDDNPVQKAGFSTILAPALEALVSEARRQVEALQ